MKISELKDGSSRVNVEGTIVKKEPTRQVSTRFGQSDVANATLDDGSGRITLTLWGENTKIAEGSKVMIENGFVSSFKGQLQLSAGKFGKIKVVE